MKPSFKKIIIEIYHNLLHTVLRSRNTRKRLTASIIVRKKIHGGCRDRYQATEPLCGPVCAGISALPTESFVSIERETEPVDRNKPIFRAISYRPRWSYPMILSPRTRYRIDLSSYRISCPAFREMPGNSLSVIFTGIYKERYLINFVQSLEMYK